MKKTLTITVMAIAGVAFCCVVKSSGQSWRYLDENNLLGAWATGGCRSCESTPCDFWAEQWPCDYNGGAGYYEKKVSHGGSAAYCGTNGGGTDCSFSGFRLCYTDYKNCGEGCTNCQQVVNNYKPKDCELVP